MKKADLTSPDINGFRKRSLCVERRSQRFNACGIPDIEYRRGTASSARANLRRNGRKFGFTPGGEDDLRPCPSQNLGEMRPQAAGTPGNECDPAGEEIVLMVSQGQKLLWK
jgi:hypothetical protein